MLTSIFFINLLDSCILNSPNSKASILDFPIPFPLKNNRETEKNKMEFILWRTSNQLQTRYRYGCYYHSKIQRNVWERSEQNNNEESLKKLLEIPVMNERQLGRCMLSLSSPGTK